MASNIKATSSLFKKYFRPAINPKMHVEFLNKKDPSAKKKPGGDVVKVYDRSLLIHPGLIGMKLDIHVGNKFTTVLVTESMIGYKVGEFAPTRKFPKHPEKKS